MTLGSGAPPIVDGRPLYGSAKGIVGLVPDRFCRVLHF
jgi:hypothetical protein